MYQAQEKPRILLLRKREAESIDAASASPWPRLTKALKTFTEFEELTVDSAEPIDANDYLEKWDHLFLDAELPVKSDSPAAYSPKITLVRLKPIPWPLDPQQSADAASGKNLPCLVLEELSTSDLVRILHLYLIPKRLAGVAPAMEKGSLIIGEKLMDMFNVGSLLDRLCAHLNAIEALELKGRLPDLRQILSAVLAEGFQCAVDSGALYPSVDFQASASRKKLGVNLRFPLGATKLPQLIQKTLSGEDIFWHQIWQCSDVTVISEHQKYRELEVLLVINKPERSKKQAQNTLLFKSMKDSARKESLLEAPESYTFKLLSDIKTKDSTELFISEGGDRPDIDLASLPEPVFRQLHSLEERCQALQDNLARKEASLQDSLRKSQSLTQELGQKRGELLRTVKSLETNSDGSERKIRELESKIEQLKASLEESAQLKNLQAQPGMQEAMARLEAMVRSAEAEKTTLRENIAVEQKRVASLEQKYSTLYKELSLKDRELNEIKGALNKMRKDQAQKTNAGSSSQDLSVQSEKLKELEAKDITQKQEIRKLTFKLDNQEKYAKAQQSESAEKLNMLDQKLKAAKAKELELLKKTEELTAALKRAHKVA